MNGIHDVGGMHGFGAVLPEENEPVFHQPWEGRVYTMLRQFAGRFPAKVPGLARDIIEQIEPARYLSIPYYERFLEVLEKRALAEGIITEAELEARMKLIEDCGADPIPRSEDTEAAKSLIISLKTNQLHPPIGVGSALFAAGDKVVARNLNWSGHNRLPRYIRGKRGWIERVNGCHLIEDSHSDALGPNPQTVYTVGFEGAEVWGPECEANLKIYMELWEGYLEPATAD